jgi:2-keto-3-deoxy-L-rhamnonate aldolase RhmA
MNFHNPIKEKIKARRPVVTSMIRLPNPTLAVIMAKAGVESITIDNEHYPFTDEDITDICRAVHGEGVCCMIRVGDKNLNTIYRVMDMGLDGVLLPNVETAEEAQMIVDAVKYPPMGRRGCCPITRGADYGINNPQSEYYANINDTTIVGVMIESKKGYENLDAIMAVKGIDYFAIGPSDFSGSYGRPGQAATDPEIKAEMTDAYARMVKAGYSVTGLAYTPDAARKVLESGRNLLNIGSDVQMLAKQFSTHVTEVKEIVSSMGIWTSDRPVEERMRAKEPVAMPYLRIADPACFEIAALCGVELMVIDDEHYPFSDKQLINIIRAVHGRNSKCIVRVHDKTKAAIGRILDMGADGIVAPQVKDYEEVLGIVKAAKYGPVGCRGLCPITAGADYGFGHTATEYAEEANKRTIVGIMVETKSAVEDIDRILSIPELDYISVGPSDISASYGLPGQYDSPVVKNAMESVWSKTKASHVALAGQTYTSDKVEPAIRAGKNLLNIGSDVQYMIWGFQKVVEETKKVVEEFEK